MMLLDLLLDGGTLSVLESIDKQWLLAVNGSESLYLDRLARGFTNGWTWLPLYLSLFYLVIKNNERAVKVVFILCSAGLCVLLAGTVDDLIVKPMVARWRPTHDPEIGMLVDIVDGYRGGRYGFFSAHASNTFSIAVFFCWLIRHRVLSVALVLWSFTNCWTRLYLGVHYPGDILVGLVWGATVGTLVFFLYYRFTRMMVTKLNFVSNRYTKTGYDLDDINVVMVVLLLTVVFILIKSCIL